MKTDAWGYPKRDIRVKGVKQQARYSARYQIDQLHHGVSLTDIN